MSNEGQPPEFIEVSIAELAKAIFSDAIADGPHLVAAEIIAQFEGGLWRIRGKDAPDPFGGKGG